MKQQTPQKFCEKSLSSSLQMTPVKEERGCPNSGTVMSPLHQCDETENVSQAEEEVCDNTECVKVCKSEHGSWKIANVTMNTQGAFVIPLRSAQPLVMKTNNVTATLICFKIYLIDGLIDT